MTEKTEKKKGREEYGPFACLCNYLVSCVCVCVFFFLQARVVVSIKNFTL